MPVAVSVVVEVGDAVMEGVGVFEGVVVAVRVVVDVADGYMHESP